MSVVDMLKIIAFFVIAGICVFLFIKAAGFIPTLTDNPESAIDMITP